MNTKEKLKILLLAGMSILCLVVFFLTSQTKVTSPPNIERRIPEKFSVQIPIAHKVNTEPQGTSTTLEIETKQFNSKLASATTVYNFMQRLKDEGQIVFTEKTFAGMGKLIDGLNGIKNNGDKNWIYYVNGIKATVGVSNYQINPGDVVSWKFENDIN